MYSKKKLNDLKFNFFKLKKPDLGPTALAVMREFFLKDFYLFAKFALNYQDLNFETHGETIKLFESQAKKKIAVLPRGTFKSSLGCVAYPMWRLEREPDLTILIDSEVYNNSKNFLREIKAHYQSSKYQMIFGDRVGPKWGESEVTVSTRQRNRKEASITVGGIGTVKVGQHYDVIIGDDYNSPSNSDTPEKCQKVIDHVRYNLNILNPGGEYVFIGTRYAERDVIGFLLKEILGEAKLAEGKIELMTSEDVLSEQNLEVI